MIENELRELLAGRAASVPDNPTRPAEVRSRVRAIRRRRGVGAALALVLLAVVGAVLTRLPGRPDALPPASPNVPAPPYFTDDGNARKLPGFQTPITKTFVGTAQSFTTVTATNPDTRWLLAVRCARPGALGVRSRDGGGSADVPCRTRIGDHYEGALALEPAAATRLLGNGNGVVILSPGTAGSWAFAAQEAMFPDRLPPVERVGRRPLLEGPEHPEGGTVPVVVPQGLVLQIQVQCVHGVVLRFLVGSAELAAARCEPQPAVDDGQFVVIVPPDQMERLGLRARERVSLAVRPDGGSPGQWRVIVAGP